MTVVAICSTRSSPGVTSLSVALGAAFVHRGLRPLLIEADPAGGVIGLRFALSADPSLRTLWADMRRGFSADVVQQNTTDLRGIDCLLAPTDPLLAVRALDHVVPVLAEEAAGLHRPVIIDLGRISDGNQVAAVAGLRNHHAPGHAASGGRGAAGEGGGGGGGARGRPVPVVRIPPAGSQWPADRRSSRSATLPITRRRSPRLPGCRWRRCCPTTGSWRRPSRAGRFKARKLRRSALWRCVSALGDQLTAGAMQSAPTPVPAAPVAAPPPPNHSTGAEFASMPADHLAHLDPEATIPRRYIPQLVNAGVR